MLGKDYEGQTCSIAGCLELIGERWSLLIVRDVFRGKRRFAEIQESLGIARNVLTARLQTLVSHGILERRLYQERPERFEYRLTEKGRDLYPVLISLMRWGDKYTTNESGPPVRLTHECGHDPEAMLACSSCGKQIVPREVKAEVAPGVRNGAPPRRD